MQQQNIDLFLATKAKYFLPEHRPLIISALERADESKFTIVQMLDLKDPTTYMIVSIFVGGYGIDRFMLGDIGMGVLKLLTGGLCGVLWIYDMCTIMNKVREKNFEELMNALA